MTAETRGATNALAPLKLNLGCCDHFINGYVGVDICPGPGVQVVADLTQRWPWDDGTVDEIAAFDIIEHLPEKIHTMNEAYRVLRYGGAFDICVPTTDGRAAFQDPTHVSFWNRHSFWYYEAGNVYRERFAKSYKIRAAFQVMKEKEERTIDGPKLTIRLIKV